MNQGKKGGIGVKRTVACLVAVMLAIPAGCAGAFPFSLSVRGGIGMGYYSMSDLNAHIGLVRQHYHVAMDDLANGINVNLHGRIWFIDRIAASVGYEHFWGDTSPRMSDESITYKTPCDVYSIGGVLNVLTLPKLLDLNLGVNLCYVRSIFGTNIFTGSRLLEFKGNDNGYEVFGEVATGFFLPVEVGMQLGYRGLKVDELKDRFNQTFDEYTGSGLTDFSINYSGVYFYLFTGIRI